MSNQSELQGELSALCCLVVALASTLPLSSQLRLWPAFEQIANPLRERLYSDGLGGFERATVSLASKQTKMN